jgi:hopanoid biosynthesis associated protein HpnK
LKRVIITGDDFGIAVPVNEAIAEAHRRGVLTTTSLMVAAPAAGDAVIRARSLPTLHVGLHLVLVEGRPVLPPARLSALVDAGGEFSRHLVRAGFIFAFRPGARRQLEAEIRAQFESFSKTGLVLDHVNAHNHMHLHPTILDLMLTVGKDYGMRAVRVPFEPPLVSWRATRRGLVRKAAASFFLYPWIRRMRGRLRRAGIHMNDRVFGMADSGGMTTGRVREFLQHLPEGITEIYFHPAIRSCPEIVACMPNYRHEEEFRTLIDPALKDALRRAGADRIAYADLWQHGGTDSEAPAPAGRRLISRNDRQSGF